MSNKEEKNFEFNVKVNQNKINDEVDKKLKQIKETLSWLNEQGFSVTGLIHASEIMKEFGPICPGCAITAADKALIEMRPLMLQKIKEELDRMMEEGKAC